MLAKHHLGSLIDKYLESAYSERQDLVLAFREDGSNCTSLMRNGDTNAEKIVLPVTCCC